MGALGKRETSGTLPRNTKKTHIETSRSQITTTEPAVASGVVQASPGWPRTRISTILGPIPQVDIVDIVGNELKLYIDNNLAGKPLLQTKIIYTKDNLAGNPLLNPYKLGKFGNELYKKVKFIFKKYKLSSNEIINVLSNLDMKSTSKIYQVIYTRINPITHKKL